MEQIIIAGASASGLIPAISGLGVEIRTIEIDMPLDELGSTGPYITVSGALTGAYNFYGDTSLNLRYGTEDIYLNAVNFSGSYSAIVRYIRYGDQTCMLNTRNMGAIPLPSRLTRRTPKSS